MKINKIDFKNLRNDEHFQFHTEFKDLVDAHGAEALKIKQQYDGYLIFYEKVDKAMNKIIKSEFTAKMREADKARDSIYIGMVETNTAALRHFEPEVREAAVRLKIVFDTYGSVARKPMDEETSAIYNILQELNGNYAADVATIGIGQWVAELDRCNNAFESLLKERFDEAAARKNIVLRTARGELDEAYRAVAERINAFAVIDGVAAYESFIKIFNVVIARYAAKRRRHSHNVAAKPEAQG